MVPKVQKTLDLESGMVVTIHNVAYNTVLCNSDGHIQAWKPEDKPDALRFKVVLQAEGLISFQDSKSNFFISCPTKDSGGRQKANGKNKTNIVLSESEHKWKLHPNASDDAFWFESTEYTNSTFYIYADEKCPVRMWQANVFKPEQLNWRLFHLKLAPSDQPTKKQEEEAIRRREEASREVEKLKHQQAELASKENELRKREEELTKAEAAVREQAANQSKQNLIPTTHDVDDDGTSTKLRQLQEENDTLRLREEQREDAYAHSKTPFDLTNTGFGHRRFLHLKRL